MMACPMRCFDLHGNPFKRECDAEAGGSDEGNAVVERVQPQRSSHDGSGAERRQGYSMKSFFEYAIS